MSKQKHGPHHRSAPDNRDPIGEYQEWTEHRYDPGYYTGGRLPPGVRWLQNSSKAYKRFLLIILISALGAIVWGTFWPAFR